MESTVKQLPKSQIELKIEVPINEFNSFIDRATLNLGKDLEVKGFRKGKVPKEIIEKEIGPEKILIEAADLAVRENYQKAVRQLMEKNKITPVSEPKIEIQKLSRGANFIFLAKTTILPEIKLPDYKNIAAKVERKETKFEEKEVLEALKWLQKSRAKFALKNQPAQKGDFVEIEYWSPQISSYPQNIVTEKNTASQQKGQKDKFILGEGHLLPGFEEQIVGMRAGERKDRISISIPENHPLKKTVGEKINFKIKVNSVQNVELPEIGNQFAKTLGKFENLESLKKNIKEGLILEKQRAESQRVRREILEKIGQEVKCDIPEVLVEREQSQMLGNLKKNVSDSLKISFADYLSKIKKTEKEISESFLTEARKKVMNFLILREIGKREKIEVSEQELKEEINKMLKQYSDVNRAHENLDPEKLKEYTKEAIKNEKIFQLLESFIR